MEESGEILQKFAAGEDTISMYLNDLESTLSERFEVGFFHYPFVMFPLFFVNDSNCNITRIGGVDPVARIK